MIKNIFIALLFIFLTATTASAEKILFIPHDDRPVSFQEPVEVISQLKNYEIISPSTEILTNPDDLWNWFNENALIADAAVVSSDVLLYGGLIPSRSHEISADILNSRLDNFQSLRNNYPNLKIYAFGSLMRTPRVGTPGDREEPDYYGQYGTDIFQLTVLLDKNEISKLNKQEKMHLDTLQSNIPSEILDDYFSRRQKNLNATKKLIELTKNDVIDYFVIGRDDNSPLSQTHRENRQLLAYISDIPNDKAKSHAGIDEYAMLLLTRAVNDLSSSVPRVNVQFNRGKGEKIVPNYSDEQIGDSIRDEILIAGAIPIQNPERADFVLLVNTDPKGDTFEIYNSVPPQVLTKRQERYFARNAEKFSEQVEDAVNKNLPVGVADIITANGSDNFLMAQLRDKNLLFKLQSYGGWNTATNTSGFAISTGILAKNMTRKSIDKLLAVRYLDDWAYQANVRSQIADYLTKYPNAYSIFLNLGSHEEEVVQLENQLMHEFAKKNLPQIGNFSVSNPWHRMFECQIDFKK